MQHIKYTLLIATGLLLGLASCKKDEVLSKDTGTKATLSIQFDNIVGAKNLQLNMEKSL
jgi:hypothetical protein